MGGLVRKQQDSNSNKVDESQKRGIQLITSSSGSPKSLDSLKETFNQMTLLV